MKKNPNKSPPILSREILENILTIQDLKDCWLKIKDYYTQDFFDDLLKCESPLQSSQEFRKKFLVIAFETMDECLGFHQDDKKRKSFQMGLKNLEKTKKQLSSSLGFLKVIDPQLKDKIKKNLDIENYGSENIFNFTGDIKYAEGLRHLESLEKALGQVINEISLPPSKTGRPSNTPQLNMVVKLRSLYELTFSKKATLNVGSATSPKTGEGKAYGKFFEFIKQLLCPLFGSSASIEYSIRHVIYGEN